MDVFWISFWRLEIDAIHESDPVPELQSHGLILDAVKAGDKNLARIQLLKHFENVKTRIEKYRQSTGANGQEKG
ncbi:MAG: hypothetical protein P4L50_10650 [Anaerolineaceae bacterium]|nr:hypothetical protein [Anaerolineaceae bacterium]